MTMTFAPLCFKSLRCRFQKRENISASNNVKHHFLEKTLESIFFNEEFAGKQFRLLLRKCQICPPINIKYQLKYFNDKTNETLIKKTRIL